ncbi:NUMOD1 domain-containing protein [Anaerovirgula multivorans]|uniref:NUMOD1 domain-containing protein n=1 Tax=Anaerovirgula multivorans TaxID=312168 RepID=A0A239AIB8_9FIRM|nr:NUMOD1 domain-containing DNA-binding protein [Anaerovirgula multivorans]SNR95416.1 NUMOD1 domain-containing protein [Anaerovirgula multivorans]
MEKENKYYVYEWYIKDTEEVFYVGKGSGYRIGREKRENKYFMDMKNSHDCHYRKIHENLSEEQALQIEMKTIKHYRENTNFRITNILDGGNQPPVHVGKNNHNSKKVVQYTSQGDYIKEYDCINQAIAETKITGISSCARGETTHAGGFLWAYDNNIPKIPSKMYRPNRPIVQLDIEGRYIDTFRGCMDASVKTNITHSQISDCCLGKQSSCHGYVWLFKDDYKSIVNIENFIKERFRQKNSKRIVAINKEEEVFKYESIKEASKALGVKQPSISNCLTGKNKSCKGYVFLYEYDYEKNINNIHEIVEERILGRYTRIAQLTMDGKLVAIHKNTRSAKDFDHSSISKCCRGKAKHYKKFRWQYYKDFKNQIYLN